jgi:hypothetical protein
MCVFSARPIVFSVRFVVFSVRIIVFLFRFIALAVRFVVFSVRSIAFSVRFVVFSFRYIIVTRKNTQNQQDVLLIHQTIVLIVCAYIQRYILYLKRQQLFYDQVSLGVVIR